MNVCDGLSLDTVNALTGMSFTRAQEGDPDSLPGSGYITYGCIFVGSDPSDSMVVYVSAGDTNQVFQDNSDGIKPTFGWGPIDGIGDRAEGDGIHILDVLWGTRYVISVVDNTPDSEIAVKNMAAIAAEVHKAIGE